MLAHCALNEAVWASAYVLVDAHCCLAFDALQLAIHAWSCLEMLVFPFLNLRNVVGSTFKAPFISQDTWCEEIQRLQHTIANVVVD